MTKRRDPVWVLASCSIACLIFVACVLLLSQPASAASIVAKDGKIHACMKARGKGKGTLRVVRNRKVRCPKRWKKVAWYAAGRPGPAGEDGATGARGETGPSGERGATGLPGRNENVVVNELEDKVTELLSRVQSLEATLGSVMPVVQALCGQTETLTSRSNELGTALGAFNTALDALLTLFTPVSLPAALPAFSCP